MKVRTTYLYEIWKQCMKYVSNHSILRENKTNKLLNKKSNKETSQVFEDSRLDGPWLSFWNFIACSRKIMNLRPTWNTEKSISKLVYLFVWLLRNPQIHFVWFCYKSTPRKTCPEEESPHYCVLLLQYSVWDRKALWSAFFGWEYRKTVKEWSN